MMSYVMYPPGIRIFEESLGIRGERMELRLQSVEQDGVLKEKTHLTTSMRRVKHTIFHSDTCDVCSKRGEGVSQFMAKGREVAWIWY